MMENAKRFVPGILLLLLLSLNLGCSSDDDEMDYRFVSLPIVAADLPVSFQLNETYDIGVTYVLSNSCSALEGFDVIAEDQTVRRVVAIGTEELNSECTGAIQELETSFRFICLYSDTYLFRFYSGMNEEGEPQYIEYEVPVNN